MTTTSSNPFAIEVSPAGTGRTIVAASAARVDVQAAIDTAQHGDTVVVPDGEVTWTGGIDTDKRITIQGQNFVSTAGGDHDPATFGTRIWNGVSDNSTPLFALQSGDDYHVHVRGIWFNDAGSGDRPTNYVRFTGTESKQPLLSECALMVSRNRNGDSTPQAMVAWEALGGVMWNCLWDARSVDIAGGVGMDGASLPIKSPRGWQTDDTLGARDTGGNINVYMEDCTCYGMGQFPDVDVRGRWVCRYCTLDGSNGTTHGFTTGAYGGGRHFEYYHNSFLVTTDPRGDGSGEYDVNGRHFWIRQGHGVFFNNYVQQSQAWSGWEVSLATMTIESGSSFPQAYPIPSQPGWGWLNGTDQLYGIWAWGNTGDGSSPNGLSTSETSVERTPPGGQDFYMQENRDWFEGLAMTVANGAPFDYAPYAYPHPVRAIF